MQLAVEEKCEFLPFLSPKKVFKFFLLYHFGYNNVSRKHFHLFFGPV